MKVVFFKSDREDLNSRNGGIKVDEYRFTLVNIVEFYCHESYALALQVYQAF